MIAPKRAALKEAEEANESVLRRLEKKRQELHGVQQRVNDLNNSLAVLQEDLGLLKEEYEDCQRRLNRATQLTESLESEKARWKNHQEKIEIDLEHLTGDMLVSAGILTYLGTTQSLHTATLLFSRTVDRGVPPIYD